MKKMMKKAVFFTVLAAMILTTALLITACMEPMGTPPPEGTGYLTLSLPGTPTGAKTIMPAAVSGLSGFDTYAVTITPTPPGTPNLTPNLGSGSQNYLLNLNTAYTITVTATHSTGPLEAAGTEVITLTAVDTFPKALEIELKPIANNGTGDFSWDITLPTNIIAGDTATIQIFNANTDNSRSTLVTAVYESNLLTFNDNDGFPVTLPSGFYKVVITFQKSGFQERIIEETLHVYKDMDSHWTTSDYSASLSVNVYTVRYYRNITTPTDVLHHTQNPNHGDYLTAPEAESTPIALPTNPPYTFSGWFRTATGGTAYDFSDTTSLANRVRNGFDLYAQWGSAPSIDLGVSFDLEDIANTLTLSSASQSILQSDFIAGTPVTFTVTATADFTPVEGSGGTIQWKYNGTIISDEAELELIVDATNFAEYTTLGPKVFVLEVNIGGTWYSKPVTLIVTDTP